MNNFGHENPGQSILQGSDLATIQVNNGSDDENDDHLDKQRLDQELKIQLDEVFNESGANMSVISSSHCSDTSEDELESHTSHSPPSHITKRKKEPIHSNPVYNNLHFVNKNFQPDFHKDGSYPSPIPQYTPRLKSDTHINSNDAAHNVSRQYVYEGISNEANYETLQALNEMRRNEIKRLERELTDTKMQGETKIEKLQEKLLVNDSEYQRTIAEYQHQCENLKKKNEYLEEQNLFWKQKVESTEKSNFKLTKELENIRINMINLEEQLTNLSRNNGSKQYDTNVDFIINDLKKKHNQEVSNLQDQYKTVVGQLKSKDEHSTLLKNELKKLQQEHHNIIKENNNLIANLTKELNALQKKKLSNLNDNDDIAMLNTQLMKCSKQNELLNQTLQKLTAENVKLRSDLSVSHDNIDKHGAITDVSKLEADYQKNLDLLQKQRDDVKTLTEILSAKDRSIAEMEKKEITYQHCMRKIQEELEKYPRDKTNITENSNHDYETLRNALEMQLEDTMCKLIRTEEDMSTVSKNNVEKNTQVYNRSIEEYIRYHQSSLEYAAKQKDEEIKSLKNRMEEFVKEIDELKQLYIKVCSEKEQSLKEKEKLENNFSELSAQFETLDKQYDSVVKEKEELAITLVGIQKEKTANQNPLQKQLMEKEIEKLKNELMMYKRQKEMIAQLKIDLAQSKERTLSLEQRLQSECDFKVANYVNQLENLKKQYDEKVSELKQANDTILKLNSLDVQTSERVNNEEKTLKSKLYDYENSFATLERKHKLAINDITFKYKNELYELEILYNKKFNEEKLLCAKMIEELKNKHKTEIDTIKDLQIALENAKIDISIKNNQLQQLKASSTETENLKEQIEEERTKFAQIMTNWAQEMRQMKDKLSTIIDEKEKLQLKYVKVKRAALGYKNANKKQQVVYNELLANCVHFLDELKTKTDQLLTDRENEIQIALKDFEDDCKQRRLALSDTYKLSCLNTS